MQITFYGVRGSYPVSGRNTCKYGGNTTCVSFSKKYLEPRYGAEELIHRIIIDSGTGIISLGRDIIKNYLAGKESLNLNIFFTHLHPDHTQGFPFFGPNFFNKAKINLYGMEALGSNIEQILSSQMTPPNFPLEYRSLKSNREHRILDDGEYLCKVLDEQYSVEVMQAFAPSHPQQGALYYKVTDPRTKKTVACIWDNESKVGGDKAVINFIRDCDVVIHDTQYTREEYESSKLIVQGFGHSTYDMAIDNALQAGVKTLICIHYNPNHTDKMLDEIEKDLQRRYAKKDLQIIFSKEGMIYTV